VGLSAALDVLDEIGLETIARQDRLLVAHARERFARVPGLRVLGTMEQLSARLPVFSFALPGIPAARLVRSLDEAGVAVRGGDMAALPLLQRFGLHEAVRASGYLYTTIDDIDRLCDRLEIEARAGR
jgi:cysteine desulfurase/selenocysteine lyase